MVGEQESSQAEKTDKESIVADRNTVSGKGGHKKQSRPSRKVPLLIIGMVLTTVLLIVVYILFVREEPDTGPTLGARLQAQQQTIVQLQDQIQGIQTIQNERREEAQTVDESISRLTLRIEAMEADRRASNLHRLPGEVEMLTVNLEELTAQFQELSNSVDVRFSATQEMGQSLESSLQEVRNNSTANQRPSVQRRPATRPQTTQQVSPPFSITGIEQRGGSRYLVVSPSNSERLSDLRLLREGEDLGQWQLTAILGNSAEFTVNGQNVVVQAP